MLTSANYKDSQRIFKCRTLWRMGNYNKSPIGSLQSIYLTEGFFLIFKHDYSKNLKQNVNLKFCLYFKSHSWGVFHFLGTHLKSLRNRNGFSNNEYFVRLAFLIHVIVCMPGIGHCVVLLLCFGENA